MRKLFTKEQEQQICKEYFSKEKPSIVILGEKWNCDGATIRNILKGNGYILRNLSESHKGKFVGENHPMYGQHHSEKTKQKIREKIGGKNHFNYGKHLSEKTRKRISISNKGNLSWCKGLTKETDERVKKVGDSNKGKIVSEKSKQKMREKALQRIQNQHGPYKDTKPELKMKGILNELTIPFEHQFRLKNHLFDFRILNTNIIIEVDGDYWHGNPKKFKKLSKIQKEQKQKDIKNEELAKVNNFVLLRFWQNDILNKKDFVINKLNEVLDVSNL